MRRQEFRLSCSRPSKEGFGESLAKPLAHEAISDWIATRRDISEENDDGGLFRSQGGPGLRPIKCHPSLEDDVGRLANEEFDNDHDQHDHSLALHEECVPLLLLASHRIAVLTRGAACTS